MYNERKMHILHRSFLSVVLLGMLAPAAHAVVALVDRDQTMKEIDMALEESVRRQRSLVGVAAARAQSLEQMEEAQQTLSDIARQKRNVRMQIDRRRETADRVRERYGIDTGDREALDKLYAAQREQLAAFARAYVRRHIRTDSADIGFDSTLLSRIVTEPLGERIEQDLQYRALKKARVELLTLVADVRDIPQALEALELRQEELIAQYNEAAGLHAAATERAALSQAELDEIRGIVAEVDADIRAMQSKLAEYDARIRDRAEKELIIKGLIAPRERKSATPEFIWPVIGRITAGFYDKSYQSYFGVAHKAIDISQAQGSPVHASADGIVYRVQHGGAKGYSYVLIGHRDGYATLYGHLFDIYVSEGQDIDQGQTIGLSGGRPGTRGAGPMTTGAHLHFEVIRNGSHVSPLSVLPQ